MAGALTRRAAVAGGAFAAALGARAVAKGDPLGAIEARTGERLGVAALDVRTGRRLAHRADERFPMCSTFKVMAVAALLKRVDRGAERLDRVIAFGPHDLIAYSPIAKPHVGGGMTLGELCAAALDYSDNTAANLILDAIGGPAGWTAFVRALGDGSSRLDRTEPALNTALPHDPRDTTTPAAMLADLKAVLLGEALSPASRQRLTDWMVACKTGDARLRAGVPAGWRVADKTGTGDRGTANDIALIGAPHGPILITVYLTGAEEAAPPARDAAIADVGRFVVQTFTGGGRG